MSAILKAIKREPSEDCIKMVEDLLEAARAGEVVSVCYAAEMTEGAVRTAIGVPRNAFTLFGAIERMKIRFHNLHLEE